MWKWLTVLVVVLALGISVGAQDAGPFCGDLSAEECRLLTQSTAMMGNLQTVKFSFFGWVELDDRFNSLNLDRWIYAISGDADLTTEYTGYRDFQVRLHAGGSGLSRAASSTSDLNLDLLIIDGIIYVDIGSLTGTSALPEWVGVDMNRLMEESPVGMSFEELEAVDSLDSPLYGLALPNTAVSIRRLADKRIAVGPVAIFETTHDLSLIVTSDTFTTFVDALREEILVMQAADPEIEDPNLDQFVDFVAAVLADTTVSTQRWIGLADYYLHVVTMHLEVDIRIDTLLRLLDIIDSDVAGAITIEIHTDVFLNQFNEPLDIVLPDDVQMIDPSVLLGSDS